MSSGVYISIKPMVHSAYFVSEHFNLIPEPFRVPKSSYHVTLVYSHTHFTATEVDPHWVYFGTVVALDWFDSNGDGCVVALLDSPGIRQRHQFWRERGASHDFPDYIPHITVATGLTKEEFLSLPLTPHEDEKDNKFTLVNEQWKVKDPFEVIFSGEKAVRLRVDY